jgi:hypothetical protein
MVRVGANFRLAVPTNCEWARMWPSLFLSNRAVCKCWIATNRPSCLGKFESGLCVGHYLVSSTGDAE